MKLAPRSEKGSTLIEMLIASVVTSIISLAMAAVLINNYKANAKVTNMSETMAAIRNVKERIGKDVREGRSIGDVYGVDFVDNTQNPPITMVRGSDLFPSGRDPVYGAQTPNTVVWPGNWGARPCRLSNTCLIVQIPITDDHNDNGTTHASNAAQKGWPTAIAQGAGNPPAPTPQDNVETHVYKIVPDDTKPGEFKMEFASFPGMPVAGYLQSAHNQGARDGNAQAILTGIIGPMDNNGQPKVFQFIDRTDDSATPCDTILPTPDYAANYTGVIVNLEVRKHDSTVLNRKGISVTPVGLKMEVFLRNNALATSTGQPQSLWQGAQ